MMMRSTLNAVRRRLGAEDGISAIQFAFVLPILMLLLVVVAPLVKAGWEYHVLTRATSHGIRYATRVDTNARMSEAGLTRRPTATEVAEFVREAASPLDASGIAVEVTPDPSGAMPGELVTVTATYEISFGPMAELANRMKGLFWGGQILPESSTVAVSAQGREE
jgi:Flp pilus assembly protein TadG